MKVKSKSKVASAWTHFMRLSIKVFDSAESNASS
jgi:hypothetical protein